MTAASVPQRPPVITYVGPDTLTNELDFQNAVLHLAFRSADCRCELCILMNY